MKEKDFISFQQSWRQVRLALMGCVSVWLLAAAFSAGSAACGASSSDGDPGSDPGGVGGRGGSGTPGYGGSSGEGPGFGGSIGGGQGGGGGGSIDAGQGGQGGLDEAGACAGDSFQGKVAPLDMFLIVDRSGSMVQGPKWQDMSAAIEAFVQDPASADLGVGLQYFPLPNDNKCPAPCVADQACAAANCNCTTHTCTNSVCSCTVFGPDSCTWENYSKPAVAMGRCADVASQVVSSLQAQKPVGGTPGRPALFGAAAYAASWAQSNPTHVVIAVLATDGEPNECASDLPSVSKVAADACAANPSIRTAVIGVGSSLTSLNAIAQAGCTDNAFIVDTTQDTLKQFREALDKIRIAVRCEFLIPAPKSGQLDTDRVNVAFTPGSGGSGETFGQVDSKDKCGNDKGWYYDNPSKPQKIVLCPASCAAVKADPTGKVNVLLGCKTIVR